MGVIHMQLHIQLHMQRLPLRSLGRVLLLLTLSASLHAAGWGEFERDFDEPGKPWTEVEAKMPAYPKESGLIHFYVSAVSPHRHFVDYPSVTVGEDGVVRYTVVVRTAGGAENVTYEGMRCATGERKLYGFGHANGSWSRNKYARWDVIRARDAMSYQRELFFSYFCAGGMGEPEISRIQRHLKSGGYQPPQ
jgi:hypothetical protein